MKPHDPSKPKPFGALATRCLTVATITAAATIALGLAACGKKPESAAGPSSESKPDKSAGELRLFCWSEYVPQSVIDKFTEETGIKVLVENYASNEEMVQKLVSGGGAYDLIQPSEYTIEALIKDGMLLKLDHANLPNLGNLDPAFSKMKHDPGYVYSVPWMAGTVGICVNTERVTTPITGFADVFKPEHKGRIVVLDDAREIVSWALSSLGIPANDITPENLAKARGVLQQWLPLVKVYDSDSPKTALLNGDVDMGVIWSGEGALLFAEDPKFKWVIPSEGTHLFIDSLAIPKTSKNKANAEKFINFILQPEISKLISDDFPYLNPNKAARALLTPEQLSNPASFPTADQMEKLDIFHDIGGRASEIDTVVTELKLQ